MTILNHLAAATGRRDELPNIELARKIASKKDVKAVAELIGHLTNKSKAIRHDCIKVLYEVGELNPALISPYTKDFVALLGDTDNRMQWGAMTALDAITSENPRAITAALPQIIMAGDKGSVITKDHVVNILVKLALVKASSSKAFALLIHRLQHALPNQLPMYAEKSLPVVTAKNKAVFIATLSSRLDDMEKETKRKRVEKVIVKAAGQR